MTDTIQTNGNGEPSPKELEIAKYLAGQSDERNAFAAEVARLKQRIAELEAIQELHSSFITTLESRVASAYAVRDKAVAEAEKNKAINAAALAVLRAGEVENVPLVRETQQDIAAIGGA